MAMARRLKIVLIGDDGVGKSSVLARLKGERLQPRMITYEPESYDKWYEQLNLTLEIWDTPGSEDRRTVAAYSYQHAKGIMVFFDLEREETFSNVEHWLRLAEEFTDENFKVFIVGNKLDKKSDNWSSTHDVTHICRKYNARYFEISAKDRNTQPIQQMFLEFAQSMVEGQEQAPPAANNKPSSGGMNCLIL